MRFILLNLSLLLALTVACVPATVPVTSTPPAPTQSLMTTTATAGTPLTLTVGQTATLASTPWQVRFDSVVQDSRCPTASGVVCVWEGNAEIALSVQDSAGTWTGFTLGTCGNCPHEVTQFNHTVTLVTVAPDPGVVPVQPSSLKPEDYTITLVIDGKASQ